MFNYDFMHSFPLKASETLTFQQAIALTQSLLSQAEAGELSEPDISAGIAELVLTDNGARGFFGRAGSAVKSRWGGRATG